MTFYFLLYGVLALWVLFDGINRKLGFPAASWAIGTLAIGPVVLPVYLASRPLKVGEVREGGKAWNVLKNFAILWTIVMVIMTVVTLTTAGNTYAHTVGNAESVGAGIGMILVLGILAAVWFFPTVGAALIGFLLKKNSIIEHGPAGTEGSATSATTRTGWAGLGAALLIASVVIAAVGGTRHVNERAREQADQAKGEASKQSSVAKEAHDEPLREAAREKKRQEFVESFNHAEGFIKAETYLDQLGYVYPDHTKNLTRLIDQYLDDKEVSSLCGKGFGRVRFRTSNLRQVVHRNLDCPSSDQ